MKHIVFTLMLFLFAGLSVFAQDSRMVSGVVTDNTDIPLPGVNVLVDGTNIGTITDVNGEYSINVPEGRTTLVFTYIGFTTATQEIGLGKSLNIIMSEDLVGLDEVVVTALGIKREKKALGYATTEVDGEEINKTGEINLVQSLASKSSGVQVISSGGTPGASSKILLRGNATFTGQNQPLFVVDGVPIDNETRSSVAGDFPFNENLASVNYSNRGVDINPDDIESVTVLKGPVAAGLYGVRAGNGAIVITTKKGSKNKDFEVTFSTGADFNVVNKLPELQDTYAQGTGGGSFDEDGNVIAGGTLGEADKGADGIWGDGPYNPFSGGDGDAFGTSANWGPAMADIDSAGRAPVDNVGNFFQTGVGIKNNLAVSGGNQKASFRLSLGQLNQSGIIPNSEFKRYSIRMTGEAELSSNFTVGATVNYINSGGVKVQNGSNLSGVMLGLTRTPPSFDLLGGDGPNGWDLQSGSQHQYFIVYDNPYWTVNKNQQTDDVNRVLGNFFLNYKPNSFMDVTARIGGDVYSDQRKQVFSFYSWDPPNPTGQVEENIQRYKETYSDILVGFSGSLTNTIKGRLTLGNNLNIRSFQDSYSRGRDFALIPGYYNLSGASDLYADEYNEIIRTAALFADANLEFNRFFYVNGTIRQEYASNLGTKKDFLTYSASTSFVFSELLFPNGNNVLSFGKIRYGFSNAGISPTLAYNGTYFRQPTFTDGFTDGVSFPFLGQNGFGYSDRIGDPDLTAERNIGNELGLDLRFFNGRLNIDATLYRQESKQLLVSRPLPGSTGFEELYSNFGEMINRGVELEISGTPLQLKGFDWTINANFSRNVNEVTVLAPGVEEINIESAFTSIGSFAIVGDPYGALYGTKWERVDNEDPTSALMIGGNGLPIVQAERGNVGNPFPDWLAGIRNTFSTDNFSVTALIDIRKGGDIWCGTCARLNRLGRTAASANRGESYIIEGVKEDGSANDIPVDAITYFQQYIGDAGGATEQMVFDGSWVRLRELGLNYRFDIEGNNRMIEGCELGIVARNLLLNTEYPGVDPETSLTGAGSNVSGFDYFNNPSTKSYSVSLRLKF